MPKAAQPIEVRSVVWHDGRVRFPWRILLVLALPGGCTQIARDEPPPLEIHFPTEIKGDGAGRWVYVANGDLNGEQGRSSIVTIDRAALALAIVSGTGGCHREISADANSPLTCTLERFARPQVVAVPSGVSSLHLDESTSGSSGVKRLLAISRMSSTLTWMDITDGPEGLGCGQLADGSCNRAHVLTLPSEPAHIYGDNQGFRYAYVPHLLGQRLTLIRLDGDFGPEVANVAEEFFELDPYFDSKIGGGFAVAQLPCRVDPSFVPANSSQCRRPALYASERFGLGSRVFSVSPGRATILPGPRLALAGADPFAVDRPSGSVHPVMGDLDFVATQFGPLLVGVQVNPPLLFSVDMRLDEFGEPAHQVVGAVSLCGDPNRLALRRGPDRAMAFVSCMSEGRIAVVDLDNSLPLRVIDVDPGANAMWIDDFADWLWVANARAHTLSVVDINRNRPSFLHVLARVISPE
jgi:hypothetical protein